MNDNDMISYDRRFRARNDIIPTLYGIQQLYNLQIETNSPLFRAACINLGILHDECILLYLII